VFAGFGHHEHHALLVQVGQPQHVGFPLRLMARLKAAGKMPLHILWRRPFVEPTTD